MAKTHTADDRPNDHQTGGHSSTKRVIPALTEWGAMFGAAVSLVTRPGLRTRADSVWPTLSFCSGS